jgi:hypothetical protein
MQIDGVGDGTHVGPNSDTDIDINTDEGGVDRSPGAVGADEGVETAVAVALVSSSSSSASSASSAVSRWQSTPLAAGRVRTRSATASPNGGRTGVGRRNRWTSTSHAANASAIDPHLPTAAADDRPGGAIAPHRAARSASREPSPPGASTVNSAGGPRYPTPGPPRRRPVRAW